MEMIPIRYMEVQPGQMRAIATMPDGREIWADAIAGVDIGAVEIAAIGGVEIGRLFGKKGKFRKAIKKVIKKAPVRKALKKVAKNKLTKGLYSIAKRIPVYGQILEGAVKAGKAVAKVGKGIADRVRSKSTKGKLLSATRSAVAQAKAAPTPKNQRRAKTLQLAAKTVAKRDKPRAPTTAAAKPTRRVAKPAPRTKGGGRYIVETPAGRKIPVTL